MPRPDADAQFAADLKRTLGDPTVREAFKRQESALVDAITRTNPFDEKQLLNLCYQIQGIRRVLTASDRHEQSKRLRAVPNA